MLKRLFLGLILISSQVSSAYVDSVRVLELSPVRIDFNDSGLNKQALFCSAVTHGKIELAEVLIKAGVNVNCIDKDGTPILLRAQTLEMIKLLLNAGADVNFKSKNIDWTIFVYGLASCDHDAEERVRLLIAAGADVNSKDDKGETALMFAIRHLSSIGLIELLIAAGADINSKDDKGETALMFAVRRYSIELIELLINAGADANVKNNEGQTLLDIACETICIPAIEFLQNYYKEQETKRLAEEQAIKKSSIEIQNNSDNSISVLHNTEVPAHSKAIITTEISKI